ncbi:MAG: nickel pincer cofactor biosynthesis protein LarC [Chloroflexi bacterium]|nr:nickel pincer cofactor biosynthesis protein LarC [Chloroflexota bacterium]
MKTLYFECNMGAAGDMMMAALLELYPYPDQFLHTLNSLGIPGVNVKRTVVDKCGIKGTSIVVEIEGVEEESGLTYHAGDPHHELEGSNIHDHQHNLDHDYVTCKDFDGVHIPSMNYHEHVHGHSSSTMKTITELIDTLPISDSVKSHAKAVYDLIASAESHVHGVPVSEIHFHEVGTLDAVVDIVGVCLLLELLAPERIIISPICVGNGQVKTSHGILPVPAPATTYLLQGVPIYSGGVKGELCTPTGAALLKHFADSFSNMPVMQVTAVGYGMGKKDFKAVNCVRAFLGDCTASNTPEEQVVELCCNLDDMTPEALGFAMQILLDNGALDAFIIPIQMKKNRPAQMLVCMCNSDRAYEMAALMLKHTSTIGVRQSNFNRYVLESDIISVNTTFGDIRIKISTGYGLVRIKPEYDDVERCAKEHNVSFETVYQATLASKRGNLQM